MKLNGWIIIVLAFFTSPKIYGQDTVSVYFEFGQSKLADNQLEKINALQTNYDFSDLDSVYYIGMADSVGNLKANFKLSEKRAKNVAKYSAQFIPDSIQFKIKALGEGNNVDSKQNRRVDIILYFQPFQSKILDICGEDIYGLCYNIDYKLLHRCHIRNIKKRKKELIIIETTLQDVMKKKGHFYGSITDENFGVTKVKWSAKRTGNLWWAKTRYIATIPKEDFDNYKIFKIEKQPCDTCSEDFISYKKILKIDTCIQVDRFLINNIQLKTSFFNNKSVKIRVPREYVNIDDKYYIGCDFDNKLIWESSKRKRKRNYYYSTLPRYLNYIANITRVMECCKYNPEPSECGKPLIYCDGLLGPANQSYILNAEIGSYFQQSTITPYTGIGINKEGLFSRVNFLFGTDVNLSFMSALRYQYHFLSFPFSALNPTSAWQSPREFRAINKYGRLYLGSEIKTRINENVGNYLEQNIHLGLAAVNVKDDAFIPRIFIQYGIGFDYLSNNSSKIYPVFQIGLNMKIAELD